MLHAPNALSTAQSKGNQHTTAAMMNFLDYCATHPNTTIRFSASDMILKIHSDASYLTESHTRSCFGGYFYLGNHKNNKPNNGAVHIIAKIIKNMVSSAVEAKIAGVFMNTKAAIPLCIALKEMGHKQGATEVITNNSTVSNILNNTCKQLRSKAIDMRYYWVRDCIGQKQFKLIWNPGIENLADYFTKHHSPAHQKRMQQIYLYIKKTIL